MIPLYLNQSAHIIDQICESDVECRPHHSDSSEKQSLHALLREARYPRFEVRREVTGYFHSLEDAERRIRKYVVDEEEAKSSGKYRSDYDYYYGFVVDEIPFDWHLTGDAQHTRIYMEDGTFLHETKVSSLYNKDLGGALEPFDGHPKEECRFEVGELVEVLSSDTLQENETC